MEKKYSATEEQLIYSVILDRGMKLGLLIIVATFLIYVSGILTPHIPVSKISGYWGLSVHKYLQEAGIPTGWAWVGMVHKGDFLNFIGIAFLAGVTLVCFLGIIPILFRKGDRVYAAFAVLEVLVLALAASGILKTGGH
jgi:hypothetical protein